MVVFFGDSFTSGENNSYNFVDCLNFDDARNYGVSGTTLGEYSIYPVDGNSLLSLIAMHADAISEADTICLEYGINDTTAIMCGFATLQKVVIDFVKAIDWIRQLNPSCKILFLSLSGNCDIIKKYAELQCRYLSEEYFINYDFNIPSTLWADTYIRLVTALGKSCSVINLIDDIKFFDNYLSDDLLHPTSAGHKIISDKIVKYI